MTRSTRILSNDSLPLYLVSCNWIFILIFFIITDIFQCFALGNLITTTIIKSNYANFGLGYGNATGNDFFRWLTIRTYCTGGKTCAITNSLTCQDVLNLKIKTGNDN
eukprot:Pgem_evm1s1423